MKNVTDVLNYDCRDISNYFYIINFHIETFFFSVVVTELFTYGGVLWWEVMKRAVCAYPLNKVPMFFSIFNS